MKVVCMSNLLLLMNKKEEVYMAIGSDNRARPPKSMDWKGGMELGEPKVRYVFGRYYRRSSLRTVGDRCRNLMIIRNKLPSIPCMISDSVISRC